MKGNKRVIMGQAVRFAIVGVGATVISLGLYWVLLAWLPAGRTYLGLRQVDVAFGVGYFLSFLANYVATCLFTFRQRPTWRRFVGMSASHAFNCLLQWALLRVFLWLGVPEPWAPFPMYVIAVPVNFLLIRHVFRRRGD